MTITNNAKYRSFIFTGANNSERLTAEYRATEASFVQSIQTLLEDYGFGQRLAEAKQAGRKLRILNIICGEGLYLYKLAELLEKAGWLEAAELYGIEGDANVIATAEEFSRLAKPPRPYLNFFTQDIQQPLETNIGLARRGKAEFDLIVGIQSLSLVPNARQIIERLYRDNLKPGGLLYLRDWGTGPDRHGYVIPHPVFESIYNVLTSLFLSTNQGLSVAEEYAGWLKAWGAENIQLKSEEMPCGGPSEAGRQQMRSIVILQITLGPGLVQARLLDKSYYDELVNFLYTRLNLDMVGSFTYFTTLARKPLS